MRPAIPLQGAWAMPPSGSAYQPRSGETVRDEISGSGALRGQHATQQTYGSLAEQPRPWAREHLEQLENIARLYSNAGEVLATIQASHAAISAFEARTPNAFDPATGDHRRPSMQEELPHGQLERPGHANTGSYGSSDGPAHGPTAGFFKAET